MGISAKPIGKFQSIMRKVDNELKKEREALKVAPKKPKKNAGEE